MKIRSMAINTIVASAILYGCKKPFNITIANNYTNILVVEGAINSSGTDSTVIKLSRTGKVDKAAVITESKAVVTVEDAHGTVLTLAEGVSGTYSSPRVGLDNAKQYRSRIKTNIGSTYLSDFVDVKTTPPIDSVGYAINSAGLQIYANTHDPNNNTHYYKYNYRETWQFNARYQANYIAKDTGMVLRNADQQIYYCYGTDTSSHTIINSTAALSQDIAYQIPIIAIDSGSEKIETKYSILLTQQALTKEAYAFYLNLQKNTEGLGSIFDAQPSQLIGNIYNIADATEPVIGYITAGTSQQKRIYLTKAMLPKWQTIYPYGCKIDSAYYFFPAHFVPPDGVHTFRTHLFYVEEQLIPQPPYGYAFTYFKLPDKEDGYTFSTIPCTDCTIRGITKPPAFWK